jgi:alpha-methylacyl-CoA racemase
VRFLDLTGLLPGPYCSRIFADWGAEVIKVERPGQGDWLRYLPPLDPDTGRGLLFGALNRGKKSLTLNLKSAEGRAILMELAENADVLLEGFRPGVMERLGLGYDEELARLNPRLVYCALSGYGLEGPYRGRAGHDLNYIGLAGLLELTGAREGPPVVPGTLVADVAGALWGAIGILQALLERERTGMGQRVDASLLGGALASLPVAVTRCQGGQPMVRGASDLTGGVVCYQVYETQDGRYVTLGALEPEFWAAFCQGIGRHDLLGEQYAPAVLGEPAYEALCALFRGRTRDQWATALAGLDVCLEPAYSVEEALDSPAVRALGMVIPGEGFGLLPPVALSDHQLRPPGGAPGLGEHTAALLAELGHDAAEVERLRGEGVL